MIRRLTDARRSNVHLSGDESLPGGDESAPVTPSDGDKKNEPGKCCPFNLYQHRFYCYCYCARTIRAGRVTWRPSARPFRHYVMRRWRGFTARRLVGRRRKWTPERRGEMEREKKWPRVNHRRENRANKKQEGGCCSRARRCSRPTTP